MDEISYELKTMYEARKKLIRLVMIQEELEYNKIGRVQPVYGLTQEQIDAYTSARQAEKQQLITELAAMMNAYLSE